MISQSKHIMKGLKRMATLFFLLLLSTAAFSQDPGGSPDGPPPAVPFDDYLHLILIAMGLVFALFKIGRVNRLFANEGNKI